MKENFLVLPCDDKLLSVKDRQEGAREKVERLFDKEIKILWGQFVN
jgi:hypothetical protein